MIPPLTNSTCFIERWAVFFTSWVGPRMLTVSTRLRSLGVLCKWISTLLDMLHFIRYIFMSLLIVEATVSASSLTLASSITWANVRFGLVNIFWRRWLEVHPCTTCDLISLSLSKKLHVAASCCNLVANEMMSSPSCCLVWRKRKISNSTFCWGAK